MEFQLLRVYYKAAVIVPFYTACFFVLSALLPVFLRHGFNIEALENSNYARLLFQDLLYSGIIGFLTLTAFFNCYKQVAYHPVSRMIAWMFLPYSFIAYILIWDIDWEVMQQPGKDVMVAATVMIILCFLHVIGIIISFIDFKASVINFQRDEEQKAKEKSKNLNETVDTAPFEKVQ